MGETTTLLVRARRELNRERTRVGAELEAFDAFASRVCGVRPTSRAAAPSDGVGTLRTSPSPRTPANRVVAAYRETVMALPHYEEDYGNTLVESMSTELGGAVATALCVRTEFSPLVKRQTLAAANDARDRRAAFRASIRTEAESLAAASTLTDVAETVAAMEATPAEALDGDRYDRIDEVERLRRRCDRLAADRQETLQSGRVPVHGDEVSPVVHLYRSLPTSYPVLSALATLGDRLDAIEADVVEAVASRDR